MKIVSIGGGPAGLYLGILAKKVDPRHEVVVYERNRADDTFGWGVVFSEQTLGNLRDADAESYAAIERAFARWSDVTIHDRGTITRSTGHDFCGLSRKRLLQILQARALELGVEVLFSTDVPVARPEYDWRAVMKSADLVLGADGLNSGVRAAFADVFRPSLDVRPARYIWLGASCRLPEFTFFFRENGHGLFQVHAYPFDEDTSTFIVETDEETWRNAGLDVADEAQSIAYCQALFAKELDGATLQGNRSRWLQFTTVRNERWSHENVVLLGDAAHTAHFSIGSGTKLAMEDSIALARALASEPDVPRALASYEVERRPAVERIQRSAQESMEWFENVRRYHEAFEPTQFAFALLTRSRRLTHANLRQRDGALLAAVDRGFARSAGLEVPADGIAVPPIFTPLTLRGLALENRVVVSSMCMYSAVDGMPSDFHLVHLGSRAMGGAGLVMTEMTDVAPDARITLGCTGIWSDEHETAWKRIVDYVHTHTHAKIGLQLAHAGRKGATRLPWESARPDEPMATGAWEVIGPSPLPYAPYSPVPRAMTRADMDRVKGEFARAAARGARAGFDLCELHLAHGYLLSSFLTPISNQRTDEYGGAIEGRMRFPLEVFDAVRDAWPNERPLSARISASDWIDGGITPDEVVVLARALAEHGCDIVDVSSGMTTPDGKPPYGRCWMTHLSDLVRNEARVPTMTVGGISTPDEVNSILAAGRADLCVLARPHLADPYWTLHAAAELGVDVPWPTPYFMGKAAWAAMVRAKQPR